MYVKDTRITDLTGQIYNGIEILSFVEKNNGGYIWKCKCHCGNIFNTRSSHLKNGHTKSCGCATNRKYNKYEQREGYMILYSSNENNEFLFDKEDYDKIKDYCWGENKSGYLITTVKRKLFFFHKLIMGNPESFVDHINRDTSDNKKENLRLATVSENNCNIKIRTDNTSKKTGVSKSGNKWRARIGKDNKYIHLGLFDTFEEAVEAREEAEKIYHGEFSPNAKILNSEIFERVVI